MRCVCFQRLARLGTGAVLLLLVQVFAASGSVWASCNHLVTSRSDPYLSLARLDGLFVTGSPAKAMGATIQSPLEAPAPARQLPCSGLTCSSRDSLPSSTIAAEPGDSDQWGALIAQLVPKVASPPFATQDEPASCSQLIRISIFHPPRV